jgi:LysR family transcriptional regulator, chromosome initiation inhibitor
MLDYASLSAVAVVIREGSFEGAARALNVTPSAISQRVKQLEERVRAVSDFDGRIITIGD